MKKTILDTLLFFNTNLRNPINQASSSRSVFVTALLIACFAFSPQMQALSPPPDGGYPNGNTAEGDSALAGLTIGFYNSAVGFLSLLSNADASFNTGVGAGVLLLNTASENTAVGAGALLSNTTGIENTADGAFALFSNDTGNDNTALGTRALFSNTIGGENTANGAFALFHNTIGSDNTANGSQALFSNTEGSNNTAIGQFALAINTTGGANTAVGAGALASNSEGLNNTATGVFALGSNVIGSENTANGGSSLSSNTIGGANAAFGFQALLSNVTGNSNTAIGNVALFVNTEGSNNTAVGFQALSSNVFGSENTAVGSGALPAASGNSNIAIGAGAGAFVTTADNVICIGAAGADQDDSCYIDNIFASEVALDGVPVLVDSLGKLGVQISSRRFKEDVQPMDKTSEAIMALKPVTFHYKSDANHTQCFGLIAEEVAEVNPDLVVRDESGEILTVRYDQVNAMLLNEFLKEYKKVEEQEATIAQLKQDFQMASTQQRKEIQLLSAQLKEQAAQIQKVSAQLEASKEAPQVVSYGQ